MRRPRTLLRFLIAITVVAAGTAAVGRATGLNLGAPPPTLGAAEVAVPRCGNPTGISVTEDVTGGTSVTRVNLGNVPASCGAATLSVTVDNGTTTGSATWTVPSGGGGTTLTLSTAVPLTATTEADLVMTGP